jgi:hypothetical protein
MLFCRLKIPTPKLHPCVILCRLRWQSLISRKQKIAYCASARSGYSGTSIISCVTSYFILHTSYFILHTSYFILHASDFVRKFHDRGNEMTWEGATSHPLPTLWTIPLRKITTAVAIALKHACDLKSLPQKLQYLRQHPTPSVIPCRLRWQPQRGISRGLP